MLKSILISREVEIENQCNRVIRVQRKSEKNQLNQCHLCSSNKAEVKQ